MKGKMRRSHCYRDSSESKSIRKKKKSSPPAPMGTVFSRGEMGTGEETNGGAWFLKLKGGGGNWI